MGNCGTWGFLSVVTFLGPIFFRRWHEWYTHCYISNVKSLSRVWLFVTPWTVAYKAPLSMEFSRQEYWSGLPFPSPGDFPDLGIEPVSPALAGGFFTTEPLVVGSPTTHVSLLKYQLLNEILLKIATQLSTSLPGPLTWFCFFSSVLALILF